MQQVITLSGTTSSGNTEQFAHPLVPRATPTTVSALRARIEVPAAGTIRNLKVRLPAALGGGDALTFRFTVNGTPSALTVTITDPATSAENEADDVSLSVGDTLVLSIVGSGSPVSTAFQLTYEFEGSNAAHSIHGWGGPSDTINVNNSYAGLLTGDFYFSSTPTTFEELCGVPGTITHFRISLAVAPGVGNTRTFIIYKNGTAQDGAGGTPTTTITISGTNTTGNATFSLTVAQGDTLRCISSFTGSAANTHASAALVFASDIPNRWPIVGTTRTNQPSNTVTNYLNFYGTSVPDATESNRYNLGGVSGITVSGLRVQLVNAPGAGNSWTVTLRINGVDSAQTVTISDAATAATGPTTEVTINEGDLIDLAVVPTSGPATTHMKWTYYMTGAPTGGAGPKMRYYRNRRVA